MSACVVCGGAQAADLGRHPDFAEIRVARCRSCGVAYAAPTPSTDVLAAKYRADYRAARKEAPTDGYLASTNRRAAAQRAFILRGYPADRPPKRVLDVGCAAGSLLAAFADGAERLMGFEPDEAMAAATAARLPAADVRPTLCDPTTLPDRAFDLIALSHVLEHVPEPVAFTRELVRALAPGGRVFVEVPNDAPRELRYQIRHQLRGHMHLTFFTPPTLARCFEAAGGRVVQVGTAGPPLRDCSPSADQVRWQREAAGPVRRSLPARAAARLVRSARFRLGRVFPVLAPKPPLNWFDFLSEESTGEPERIWVRALGARPD